MDYTHVELADIHYIYGLADGNSNAARRLYAERFPRRRLPNRRIFLAVHHCLRENSSFDVRREIGRPRNARIVQFEEEVLEHFDENPSTSTRAIAYRLGSSNSSMYGDSSVTMDITLFIVSVYMLCIQMTFHGGLNSFVSS